MDEELNFSVTREVVEDEELSFAATPVLEQPSTKAEPLVQESVVEDIQEAPEKYAVEDLVKDDFYKPIERYMSKRFGVDSLRGYSREEMVNLFLNNMRGFSGGNSVRAFNEISWLNSLSDDELEVAGQAYSIYENKEGLFGETTTGEKVEIVTDFFREGVLDPANLLAFGAGKLASAVGGRAAARTAQQMAMRAYQKALTRGATQEAAQQAGKEMFTKVVVRAGREEARTLATRSAAREAATASLKSRIASSATLKEISATVGVDAAFAAGTDYAYQQGLLRTDVQEDYSMFQTGVAALGALVMGGVQLGTIAMSGRGTTALPTQAPKPTPQALGTEIEGVIRETLTSWKEKVKAGRRFDEIESDFFLELMLGNDNTGAEGLVGALVRNGYQWSPTGKDDKIANFIADVIKQSDPEIVAPIVKSLRDDLGLVVPDDFTMREFGDIFAAKVNRSAKDLNALSFAARKLGVKIDGVSLEDFFRQKYNIPESVDPKFIRAAEEFSERFLGEGTRKFQNNIIRLIVSNWSTTQLNLAGWAAAASLNSVTDLSMAIVHGGVGVAQSVFNKESSRLSFQKAGAKFRAQQTRLLNLLDPNATYESFRAYALSRPAQMRELTEVLPGGIEDVNKILQSGGFDPNMTNLGRKGQDLVEAAQWVSGVRAQDVFTKSQEFVYQLDKKIRETYGMGWNDFFSAEDARKIMATEAYAKVEAAAVDETLRAIFSKSYAGKGALGEVAAVIEDARNIPGIGLLVPFGRFFNNTVAFMADGTGISLIGKITAGKMKNRSAAEIFTRGAVTWGLVASLVPAERAYREMGLNWDEETMTNGGVTSERYEFPYSAIKGAARLLSYHVDGREVPEELINQMGSQIFGQLTRELTEQEALIGELFTTVATGQFDQIPPVMYEMAKGIPVQAASGTTRFLDPINQAVGIARGEDFTQIDRDQGAAILNNSVRYFDQIIAAVRGEELAEELQMASRQEGYAQVDKFVSTNREVIGQSSAEKMMNLIGRPSYLLGSYTKAAAADNRYNGIFFNVIEDQAAKLINSSQFKNADLRTRRNLVDILVKDAKAFTMDIMEADISSSGSAELAKMLTIYKGRSQKDINFAVKELGFDKKVTELSYDELELLEGYLGTLKEYERPRRGQ